MNLMNKMNTNKIEERSHRLMGIEGDDFIVWETLNPSYIHSHYGTTMLKLIHISKYICWL